MWLWQHKNIHKRHLLWAKLCCLCLFFHLLFLFLIFFVYQDRSHSVSISLNTKIDYGAPILFVPLATQKKIAQPAVKTIQKTTTSAPKTVVPQKSLPKTVTTTIAPAKAEPTPQTVIKKIVAPLEKIAVPEKKIDSPIKKECVAPKPAVVEQPKPIPPQKSEPVQPTVAPQPAPTTEPIIIPENARISDDYREVEALRRDAQLQKELVKHWKPPIGVSKECACEISLTIDKKGTIKDLKMIKNSGVLLYDISARQALYAMTMPQWTHGKPLIVTFKQ
jgi:TonB C terminal